MQFFLLYHMRNLFKEISLTNVCCFLPLLQHYELHKHNFYLVKIFFATFPLPSLARETPQEIVNRCDAPTILSSLTFYLSHPTLRLYYSQTQSPATA